MGLSKDKDYAIEIMQRYLDLGRNLIDTACGAEVISTEAQGMIEEA